MLYKKDWGEVKSIYEDWWEHKLDRPLIQVTLPKVKGAYVDPWAFLRYYPKVDEALNRILTQMANIVFLMDAYPNIVINLGPGSLSAYLGADLKFDERVETAWFNGKLTLDEIAAVDFNPNNEWWRYTCSAYETARIRCKDKAVVSFTDLLDPVTVTAQLRGNYPTNFLKDMFFDGWNLKKALERVQDMFFRYFEESCKMINVSENGYSTWANIWSRKKHFVIQCDTIVYFSPKMFKDFVYDLIVEECEYFDRTIWHLDGPLELKHLDDLLKIPNLDCIQWVPGDGNPDCGADCWITLYKKIHEKGKLIQIPYIPPEKVAHLLDKIPSKDVALTTSFASKEEIKNFIKYVKSKF